MPFLNKTNHRNTRPFPTLKWIAMARKVQKHNWKAMIAHQIAQAIKIYLRNSRRIKSILLGTGKDSIQRKLRRQISWKIIIYLRRLHNRAFFNSLIGWQVMVVFLLVPAKFMVMSKLRHKGRRDCRSSSVHKYNLDKIPIRLEGQNNIWMIKISTTAINIEISHKLNYFPYFIIIIKRINYTLK